MKKFTVKTTNTLSDTEIGFLQKSFTQADKDGDGMIGATELKQVFSSLGLDYTLNEAQSIVEKIGRDSDEISFLQLMVYYKNLKRQEGVEIVKKPDTMIRTASSRYLPSYETSEQSNLCTTSVCGTYHSSSADAGSVGYSDLGNTSTEHSLAGNLGSVNSSQVILNQLSTQEMESCRSHSLHFQGRTGVGTCVLSDLSKIEPSDAMSVAESFVEPRTEHTGHADSTLFGLVRSASRNLTNPHEEVTLRCVADIAGGHSFLEESVSRTGSQVGLSVKESRDRTQPLKRNAMLEAEIVFLKAELEVANSNKQNYEHIRSRHTREITEIHKKLSEASKVIEIQNRKLNDKSFVMVLKEEWENLHSTADILKKKHEDSVNEVEKFKLEVTDLKSCEATGSKEVSHLEDVVESLNRELESLKTKVQQEETEKKKMLTTIYGLTILHDKSGQTAKTPLSTVDLSSELVENLDKQILLKSDELTSLSTKVAETSLEYEKQQEKLVTVKSELERLANELAKQEEKMKENYQTEFELQRRTEVVMRLEQEFNVKLQMAYEQTNQLSERQQVLEKEMNQTKDLQKNLVERENRLASQSEKLEKKSKQLRVQKEENKQKTSTLVEKEEQLIKREEHLQEEAHEFRHLVSLHEEKVEELQQMQEKLVGFKVALEQKERQLKEEEEKLSKAKKNVLQDKKDHQEKMKEWSEEKARTNNSWKNKEEEFNTKQVTLERQLQQLKTDNELLALQRLQLEQKSTEVTTREEEIQRRYSLLYERENEIKKEKGDRKKEMEKLLKEGEREKKKKWAQKEKKKKKKKKVLCVDTTASRESPTRET
eukprot:TRINITY_DN1500_c0_g1_i6.p1 TRINITY_DN1500_c0_g1~~TRINITY_DN1500_c0_g1_i6.p1  ORF type:complete len:825 (-),score=203.69 TRINITY_DN1500_c0_g1_i6:12-2486(-)